MLLQGDGIGTADSFQFQPLSTRMRGGGGKTMPGDSGGGGGGGAEIVRSVGGAGRRRRVTLRSVQAAAASGGAELALAQEEVEMQKEALSVLQAQLAAQTAALRRAEGRLERVRHTTVCH
jgi:hypothetical protein